jgi:hypothetical protein
MVGIMEIINANLKFKTPLTPLNFHQIEFIFIHHLMAVTATPQQIHSWHLANGWSGAGYNEYIRKDGSVIIIRGDNQGVHVANYNSIGYGIACEGNYDVEKTMPDAQFKALVARVKHHIDRFPNKVKVLGHGAVNKTDCPGKNFPMIRLYQEIEKKVEVMEEDVQFTETLKYLERFGEPTAHKEMAYRLKQILENSFDSEKRTKPFLEHLKRNEDISEEVYDLINKFIRKEFRDIFRR